MELFLKSAGLAIVHVPYKGAAPSVADAQLVAAADFQVAHLDRVATAA